VETIPPFFEDKTNVSVLSKLIHWDLAKPKGTGTEVIKWAQFGEPTKTTKYDHGCWHDGARIAFFFGTPGQFEIDFVYGVRADDKNSKGYMAWRQCLNGKWYQICTNSADIGCKRYT
jgi:hypothetical protein